MRKSFGVKPMIYPEPVLIIGTYDKNGIPNAMNAAWGGISEEDEISICVSPEHKTTENILAKGEFTVSIGTEDQSAECDFVGVVSANDMPDKLARTGWHAQRSDVIDAPIFAELPMALECKLRSYDSDSCRLVGEIVNVSADERVLTNGKIDPKKLKPLIYDSANHAYYGIGERVGSAFKDGLALKSK